jgi:serine/threonine-protein kinase
MVSRFDLLTSNFSSANWFGLDRLPMPKYVLAKAARTQRIQTFMLDLFGDGDKLAAPSNELRVVTLLDRGVQEAGILNSDPETQAELYETLGRMYAMLGKNQQAEKLLRLALANHAASNH